MSAVEKGERGWHFNDGRLQITLGVPGNDQEGSFMNATLQSTENEPNLEFSVAVHVEVPGEIQDEEALAEYLGGIFGQIRHDHPELHIEIQLGPEGDGEEEQEDEEEDETKFQCAVCQAEPADWDENADELRCITHHSGVGQIG